MNKVATPHSVHVQSPPAPPASADDTPVYKGLIIRAYAEVHEKVAEIVNARMPAGSVVLDLAAGDGALSQRLMDFGYKVSCTSWNDRVKMAPNANFRVNLDREFGIDDVGSVRYPCVLAVEIIEHLRNPFEFLCSVRRILADDGVLVLTTPNIQSALSRLQVLLRGTPRSFSDEEITRNRHIFMPHPAVLALFFRQVGFRVAERHFLPDEGRSFRGARAIAKTLLLNLVNIAGTGDLKGAARIYVMQTTDPMPEVQDELY